MSDDRWKELGFDDPDDEPSEDDSPEDLKQKLAELEEKLAKSNELIDKLVKEKETSSEEPKEEEKEEEEEEKKEEPAPPEDPFSKLAENPFVQGLINKTREEAVHHIIGDDEVLKNHEDEIKAFVANLKPDQLVNNASLDSVQRYFRGTYVDEYRGATLDTRSARGGDVETPKENTLSLDEQRKKILDSHYGPGQEAALRGMLERAKKGGR